MSDSLMGKSQLELVVKKQGIVSILCSDNERTSYKTATSLRRTLSADMSSKKWLSMKRIASSDELSHCLDEEEKKGGNADQFDIWSSIVSQKDKDGDKDSVPYIHPLVKRSASGLSEKSLEVCTESLGSETGAETFSSYPSSESGIDSDEESQQHHHHPQQQTEVGYEDVRVVKYNFAPVGKKLPPPSFPPALPSRRMTPRRENGRLVLEAVSVSAQNNFKAERQDGRLVLTYLKESEETDRPVPPPEEPVGELEECFGSDRSGEDETYSDDDENETEAETESEVEIMMSRESKTRVMKLHRLALMMNKPASLKTRNPIWDPKSNESSPATVPQSLPPRPPTGARLTAEAAASFNAYHYSWRAKPTAAQAMEKIGGNKYIISKSNSTVIANNYYNCEGKKPDYDYMVEINLKGCKEQRRSLFRLPYCIAT